MFVGRVGVFTILTGYIFRPELPSYTYPEEDIIVGNKQGGNTVAKKSVAVLG